MASRDDLKPSRSNQTAIAARIRSIRVEIFGPTGIPEIADRLDLPRQSWVNYESGIAMPAEVMLRFLSLTGVDPLWLLLGTGQKYREFAPGFSEET